MKQVKLMLNTKIELHLFQPTSVNILEDIINCGYQLFFLQKKTFAKYTMFYRK